MRGIVEEKEMGDDPERAWAEGDVGAECKQM